MPVEAKPLFRPDVLRPHLTGFQLPGDSAAIRETFARWTGLLWSPQAETLKEQELLPDFLTDVFCQILGYTRAVDSKDRYTFSRVQGVIQGVRPSSKLIAHPFDAEDDRLDAAGSSGKE